MHYELSSFDSTLAAPPEALAAAGLIPAAVVSYKIPRLADNLNDGEIR